MSHNQTHVSPGVRRLRNLLHAKREAKEFEKTLFGILENPCDLALKRRLLDLACEKALPVNPL